MLMVEDTCSSRSQMLMELRDTSEKSVDRDKIASRRVNIDNNGDEGYNYCVLHMTLPLKIVISQSIIDGSVSPF